MTYLTQDERIAAGHDVAFGSLTLITSIKPSGDEAFPFPRSLTEFDDGELYALTNSQVGTRGFNSTMWRFTRLTYLQYYYLRATYCAGTLSGLVTIWTPVPPTVYAANFNYTRLNATMTLKPPKVLTSKGKFWFNDFEVIFTKLQAPA